MAVIPVGIPMSMVLTVRLPSLLIGYINAVTKSRQGFITALSTHFPKLGDGDPHQSVEPIYIPGRYEPHPTLLAPGMASSL